MKIKISDDLFLEIENYEVLGVKYTVKEVLELDDPAECDSNTKTISIKKKDIPTLEDLIHELVHAINIESGFDGALDDITEEWVTTLYGKQITKLITYILTKKIKGITKKIIAQVDKNYTRSNI